MEKRGKTLFAFNKSGNPFQNWSEKSDKTTFFMVTLGLIPKSFSTDCALYVVFYKIFSNFASYTL